MTVADIEEYLIPHYHLIDGETKSRFERSQAGIEFQRLVLSLFKESREYQQSFSFWNLITGKQEAEKQKFQDHVNAAKTTFQRKVANQRSYQNLISNIAIIRLQEELPFLQLLESYQLQRLSNSHLAQTLLKQLDLIDEQIYKEHKSLSSLDDWARLRTGILIQEKINQLKEQRNKLLSDWGLRFSIESEFSDYKNTINDKQKQEKIDKYKQKITSLSQILPILNYRPANNELSLAQQLVQRFIARSNAKVTVTLTEELSDIFFHYMLQINRFEIGFINLSSFNKVQARKLAEDTLKALKSKEQLNLQQWFNLYSEELSQYLESELQLINGTHIAEPKLDLKKEMMNSLSFLWTNSVVQKTNTFVGRLAEAHAFIQATNFSTQNESSFLAILDIYNYGKYYDHIAETKTIIQSLLLPFNPLAEEYRNIGLYEQYTLKKFVRMLIPVLIVVACIIALSFLLTPFALPELVFVAALIPEIILGLGLASLYVAFKDTVYQFCRELFYGGPYEIPEFQINERMVAAFGNEANALGVRAFYLDELRACDLQEKEFKNKQYHNTLTHDEIKKRKDNTYKRHRLCLEWYDIHSNKELGVDEVANIVVKTLGQEINEKYKLLQENLESEREEMRASVQKATSDLQDIIIQDNNPQVPTAKSAPVIKTNYKIGLFKPPICLQHKIHAEEMVNLSQELVALTA